ncbi:GAF domain-containing protein [Nocardioides sp. ChNu-153]|uniref:GAF domain-containing sensor histidine kinase n=1 Tax=Nocardioides sp. ChNu-153 TaxID=2779364 RepID=UPI0026513695|nr:GAF domain-containing protein [Nocardioides sp. ChNu-153]MDN7122709.1 GAF domain-containing protein [Nocardioides sp. ChNu-153]
MASSPRPTPRSITGIVGGDRLPHVLDLLARLTGDGDVRTLLQDVVSSACELVGARYGVLTVLDIDGRLGDFYLHGLDESARDEIGDFPVGRGVLGCLLRSDEPMRLDDVTAHPLATLLPPGHPPVERFVGVGIDRRERRLGMLYLGDEDDRAPFTPDDERLLGWLADRAAHVLDVAGARERAVRRSEWLTVSQRLAELLQPPIAADAALAHVTELVSWVFRARSVVLVRLVADAVVVVAEDDVSSTEHLVPAEHLAPGAAVFEAVHAANRSRRSVVARADSTVVVLVPFRSELAEPLVLGVALRPGDRAPAEEELELLESFVSHAVSSIDRIRAVGERQELMVLADRDRIARDLHDVVIQRIFATGLQLQGLRAQVAPDARPRFDAAVRELDQTIRDIRTTIFELSRLQGTSLRAEVLQLAAEYADALGFTPEVHVRGPVDTTVPDRESDELLATLREGLSNVVRHARASAVTIDLQADDDIVALRLLDDGVGFDGAVESGLVNVRRRAEALGGTARVMSEHGGGTLLEWVVPLPR